jgi:hypothetical protein
MSIHKNKKIETRTAQFEKELRLFFNGIGAKKLDKATIRQLAVKMDIAYLDGWLDASEELS